MPRGKTQVMGAAPPLPTANPAAPPEMQTKLEPLVCPQCGAPQPVGDGDMMQCRGCGKVAPLPPAYRAMRDAHRMSAQDAAQLDALCKDIAAPPPAWKQVAVVIGYIVGGATLVVLAIGALVGAIGGIIVGAKLDAGETGFKILVGIGIAFCGFVSVPFVGEWVIAFLATLDANEATKMLQQAEMQWPSDLVVSAVLYFLGVLPIAIAWRTGSNLSNLKELQAQLSAAPPSTPNGASGCRRCGAPLEVRPGALATRCLYCGADNLLTVPEAFAKKKKDDAAAINKQVQAAVSEREETKRSDRNTMWLLVALGPLLAPLLCAGGWLLHAVLGR